MAIPDISSLMAAIGGLGTASFSLVDATKVGPNGGISNAGFGLIERSVAQLFPSASRTTSPASSDERRLLDNLHANWINGVALADQKSAAKTLIKNRLSPDTARTFAAAATTVDAKTLAEAAALIAKGAPLTPEHNDVLARFDVYLTAVLDEGYQRADQRYRNWSRVLALIFAIVLAVVGGLAIYAEGSIVDYFRSGKIWVAVICGVIATPLAPVSKDLTSALAACVKLAQGLGK